MTSTPAAGQQNSRMFFNGTVHSATEPYAEAMLVTDGRIAWLGSDDTAEQMSPETPHEDLQRGLIAPGFVGATTTSLPDGPQVLTETLDAAAQSGYSTLRVVITVNPSDLHGGAQTSIGSLQELLQSAATHPVQTFPALALSSEVGGEPSWSMEVLKELLSVLESLDADAEHKIGVHLPAAAIWQDLLEVSSAVAGAQRQLLLDCSDVAAVEVVSAITLAHAELRSRRRTPPPSSPTVLIGFDSADEAHWGQVLNTGAHVMLRQPGHLAIALRTGVPTTAAPAQGENPWKLVSDHVHQSEDPVSARAAFNAQTRGAYRGLPGASIEAAQLNVGSEATFAIWSVSSLSVQTPNSTVAAWSTDTRARTPLLPHLDGGELPELVQIVVKGVSVVANGSSTTARGAATITADAE